MSKVIDLNLHILIDDDSYYFCVYDVGILKFNGSMKNFNSWLVDFLNNY